MGKSVAELLAEITKLAGDCQEAYKNEQVVRHEALHHSINESTNNNIDRTFIMEELVKSIADNSVTVLDILDNFDFISIDEKTDNIGNDMGLSDKYISVDILYTLLRGYIIKKLITE